MPDQGTAAPVAIARLGGAAVLLTAPAVVQLRGRWTLLRREAGRVVICGAFMLAGVILVRVDETSGIRTPG